jgi:hypothetical protein
MWSQVFLGLNAACGPSPRLAGQPALHIRLSLELRNFRHWVAKTPQGAALCLLEISAHLHSLLRSREPGSGVLLAVERGKSSPVFRALVLSIALTVAAGPSAAMLCRTWCNPQAFGADGCNHAASTASTSVAADDTCERPGAQRRRLCPRGCAARRVLSGLRASRSPPSPGRYDQRRQLSPSLLA